MTIKEKLELMKEIAIANAKHLADFKASNKGAKEKSETSDAA